MPTDSRQKGSAQAATVADTVFAQIYDLILHGELRPGEVLKESVLSERLKISRGPVREAVNRLRGLGLLEKEAYGRARVSALTLETVIEIFQLREAVEGLAVRLVAESADDAEIAALTRDFDEWQKGTSDRPFDIHGRLADICGNGYVRHLFQNELNYQIRRYRMLSGDAPGRRGDAETEHWQIIRAIGARDGALAESLMRAHIARATRQLGAMLGKQNNLNNTLTGDD